MPRTVHQILGLLGANNPSCVRLYPLTADPDPAVNAHTTAWGNVWVADVGRLAASVTTAEKDALVAAGADDRA